MGVWLHKNFRPRINSLGVFNTRLIGEGSQVYQGALLSDSIINMMNFTLPRFHVTCRHAVTHPFSPEMNGTLAWPGLSLSDARRKGGRERDREGGRGRERERESASKP